LFSLSRTKGDVVFDDTLKTALNVSLRQAPFLNVHWCNSGKAEVKNLRVSRLGDEDVDRFDVAMDYAGSVSSFEPLGDVNGEREKDVHF
jgi:hypothetical protein